MRLLALTILAIVGVAGAQTPPGSYQQGSTFKEVVLHANLGHSLFFGPADAWLDPVTAWAQGRE